MVINHLAQQLNGRLGVILVHKRHVHVIHKVDQAAGARGAKAHTWGGGAYQAGVTSGRDQRQGKKHEQHIRGQHLERQYGRADKETKQARNTGLTGRSSVHLLHPLHLQPFKGHYT